MVRAATKSKLKKTVWTKWHQNLEHVHEFQAMSLAPIPIEEVQFVENILTKDERAAYILRMYETLLLVAKTDMEQYRKTQVERHEAIHGYIGEHDAIAIWMELYTKLIGMEMEYQGEYAPTLVSCLAVELMTSWALWSRQGWLVGWDWKLMQPVGHAPSLDRAMKKEDYILPLLMPTYLTEYSSFEVEKHMSAVSLGYWTERTLSIRPELFAPGMRVLPKVRYYPGKALRLEEDARHFYLPESGFHVQLYGVEGFIGLELVEDVLPWGDLIVVATLRSYEKARGDVSFIYNMNRNTVFTFGYRQTPAIVALIAEIYAYVAYELDQSTMRKYTLQRWEGGDSTFPQPGDHHIYIRDLPQSEPLLPVEQGVPEWLSTEGKQECWEIGGKVESSFSWFE